MNSRRICVWRVLRTGALAFVLPVLSSHAVRGQMINLPIGHINTHLETVARYVRLPDFQDDLSSDQKRLVAQMPACGSIATQGCWDRLPEEVRAIFFMITYALENTTVAGESLIGRTSSIEGILAGNRFFHCHSEPRIDRRVNGWRIHLLIEGLAATDLKEWEYESPAHPTHSVFGYSESYRDHRDRGRIVEGRVVRGPFLQIVLNDRNTSADSDLDRGATKIVGHVSSPLVLYKRFAERYGEAKSVLEIERYTRHRGNRANQIGDCEPPR